MTSVFVPPFDVVPESKQLETMSFLESCSRIAGIMDILGGKLFSPMKTDVTGNVEKIKKRFLENPIDFATLDALIEFEKTETDLKRKEKNGLGVASSAIVWLKRSLKLILIFLERFLAKDYDKNLESLKSALKIAYKESLQDFHGWVVGKLVTVMMNAAPNRTTFAQDLMKREEVESEEELLRIIEGYIVNFKATVDTLYELGEKTGIEVIDKI